LQFYLIEKVISTPNLKNRRIQFSKSADYLLKNYFLIVSLL